MTDVAEDILHSKDDGRDYTEEDYEHAKKVHLPVMVAKIDCVSHKALCMQQGIMGYPTLRLFVNGERWKGGDYRGDRTVVKMTDWLQQVEDAHKSELENAGEKNVALAHKSTLLTYVRFCFLFRTHVYRCCTRCQRKIHVR